MTPEGLPVAVDSALEAVPVALTTTEADAEVTKVEEVAVLLPLQQVVVPVELVLNTYVGKSVDF